MFSKSWRRVTLNESNAPTRMRLHRPFVDSLKSKRSQKLSSEVKGLCPSMAKMRLPITTADVFNGSQSKANCFASFGVKSASDPINIRGNNGDAHFARRENIELRILSKSLLTLESSADKYSTG